MRKKKHTPEKEMLIRTIGEIETILSIGDCDQFEREGLERLKKKLLADYKTL